MIILVLIFAFVLRLISLNQSLWIDEATSILTASTLSIKEIIFNFAPGDFHPPLYYLLLKGWINVFGNSEVTARLLSIVFAVGTVYVVYSIGKKIFSTKTGFIASLLLATAPLHIYYSQEARMYSQATFLSSVAVYYFLTLLDKKTKLINWILFSVSILLLVFTDYLPVLMIAAFFVYALLSKRKPDWWKKFLISFLPTILMFFVWVPVFIKQLTAGFLVKNAMPNWWEVLGKTNLKNIFLILIKFLIGRISFTNKSIYALVVGIFVAIYGYLLYISKKLFSKAIILWLWLIVPIVLSLIIAFKVPSLSYFRLIFCLPPLYLLVACGLDNLNKKISYLAIAVLLILNFSASGIYLLNNKFHRENWRGLVSFVEVQSKTVKSKVVFVADSQMEAFRYYAKDIRYSGPNDINKDYKQIWLMRYVQPIFDSNDEVRSKIEVLGYKKTGEFDFNQVVVWRYNR